MGRAHRDDCVWEHRGRLSSSQGHIGNSELWVLFVIRERTVVMKLGFGTTPSGTQEYLTPSRL